MIIWRAVMYHMEKRPGHGKASEADVVRLEQEIKARFYKRSMELI